ncbi:MAG: hypothetical protein WA208_09135 [Thermoanaerobaculia bacterium]
MRPVARGFLSHLAGYAVPHVLAALVLSAIEVATFRPGGESASAAEAVLLQLFISAVLLACSGIGYAGAIAFVAPQHARLRLPALFGVISGALTFGLAAVGILNQLARDFGLSLFPAVAALGFAVGLAASVLVVLTARVFPNPVRA